MQSTSISIFDFTDRLSSTRTRIGSALCVLLRRHQLWLEYQWCQNLADWRTMTVVSLTWPYSTFYPNQRRQLHSRTIIVWKRTSQPNQPKAESDSGKETTWDPCSDTNTYESRKRFTGVPVTTTHMYSELNSQREGWQRGQCMDESIYPNKRHHLCWNNRVNILNKLYPSMSARTTWIVE